MPTPCSNWSIFTASDTTYLESRNASDPKPSGESLANRVPMGDRQPVPMGLLLRILLDLSIERLIPPWSMAVHSCSAGIFLHYNYGLWNDENSAVQIARAFNYNEVCTLACCCFKYVHNRFCASSTTTIVRCAMLHSTCIYCRMSDSLRSEETNITYKSVVTEYESWSSLKQSFLLYLIIIIIGMMVDYGVSEDDITRPLLHCHTRLFDTGNDIDKMPSSFGYKL